MDQILFSQILVHNDRSEITLSGFTELVQFWKSDIRSFSLYEFSWD